MPTVNVDRNYLFAQMGRTYTSEEFFDLCFEYGIELEEEVSAEELGDNEGLSEEEIAKLGGKDRTVFRIDIPANRYDMLCPEGIARALRIFTDPASRPPAYTIAPPQTSDGKPITIHVAESTARIRRYVVGAVLRDIHFSGSAYNSFIDLQEKLHGTLARKRTLVSVGTHDLDKMDASKGVYYDALPPEELPKFEPLRGEGKQLDGHGIMAHFEPDRHIGKYLHIIRDSPVYPVVLDSQRRVLSLPPIINSEMTKIVAGETRNVFIEATATDLNKANIVLNQIVCIFSEYCAQPFSIEPVDVAYPDGTVLSYPSFAPRVFRVDPAYINRTLGLRLALGEMSSLVQRMALSASPSPVAPSDAAELVDKSASEILAVSCPPTRSDVLHPCDVAEDVGIAYGFNRVPKTLPGNNTIGAPLPVNRVSDMLRREAAQAGWVEVMPLILCSHDENFAHLNQADSGLAVRLANPKTVEYQVVRTTLLPGLLKTVSANRMQPLPIRAFECQEIAVKDDAVERRARNARRFAAVYCGKSGSGFEVLHGFLDRVMRMMHGVPAVPGNGVERTARGAYWLEESSSGFLRRSCGGARRS
ncbi:beta subunit of phenylalanyl-tRNA synthetase [Hyaloraphidium curvatum]|nr:beta subunit of phenylalanyl-tRNA synthetase [Hyaloraphidium curvatum]